MNIKQFLGDRVNPNLKLGLKTLRLISQGQVSKINLDTSLEVNCELPNKILIGTDHKTGTVWLNSIFKEICRRHALTFGTNKSPQPVEPPAEIDIFSQQHSMFSLDALAVPFRGIHMIRDPRDVIISGCFYHQKSKETWLHKPKAQWQGMTYQEKIKSYDSIDDKILFEMENTAKNTIDRMLKWNYESPYFYEVKYEQLIEDYDLMLFHEIFSFLGFQGNIIPNLLTIAYNNSLFSNKTINSAHIRSGKKSQWTTYFNTTHKDRFIQLFGDCLIQLGYEKDNNWL
ncbi:MAG: sulfotransferase domain-containing protein [Microcystaceae cyanobacterium]